jgi:hypothetical protein
MKYFLAFIVIGFVGCATVDDEYDSNPICINIDVIEKPELLA